MSSLRLYWLLGLLLLVLGVIVGLVPVSASPSFRDGVGRGDGAFSEQPTRYDCGVPLLRQYKPDSLKALACGPALRTERALSAASLAGGSILVCLYARRRRLHQL